MARFLVPALVFLGGVAGLTWELLWLHHTALALGVSARASAITLCSVMIGMAAGALIAGRMITPRLRAGTIDPLKIYAALEIAVGLSGLLLAPAFGALAELDIAVYRSGAPGWATAIEVIGMMIVLGIPSAAMGATTPVFASIAERHQTTVGRLYAFNLAGAATGVLAASFVLIPALGIAMTTDAAVSIDLLAALLAIVVARAASSKSGSTSAAAVAEASGPIFRAAVVVFVTGFATFTLEVAWFRAMRATFQATTESFAFMLCAALVGLAAGARLAPFLREKLAPALPYVLALAALVVLVATPIVERFDALAIGWETYTGFAVRRFALALLVLGPAMTLIGIGLPWMLDAHRAPRDVAILYAINTAGAALGSLGAGWILLPAIGFARTAWIAALVLIGAALIVSSRSKRAVAATIVLGVSGAIVSIAGESGVGRTHVMGRAQVGSVLENREGPDSTVSVIDKGSGVRDLVIDGFVAATSAKDSHYMPWMGHLPMILHPAPKNALVICFGTGQTANAVREEGPEHLDLVDVSAAVFDMAHYFEVNKSVLSDPRVTKIVMDGRAWLRRTERFYDVITLEPLPPTFAGSNSLYSKEFYELISSRLNEGGTAAQWMPLHLLSPDEATAVAATFRAVFPASFLWIDPVNQTVIVVGRRGSAAEWPGTEWPGFQREVASRDLSADQMIAATLRDPRIYERFAELGEVITDDNQILSWGFGRAAWRAMDMKKENFRVLERIRRSLTTDRP